MLMHTNDGAIDENLFKIRVFGPFLEYCCAYPALLPTRESLVHAIPVTKLFGKITPRRTGASEPENRFDKKPVVGATTPWIRCLTW